MECEICGFEEFDWIDEPIIRNGEFLDGYYKCQNCGIGTSHQHRPPTIKEAQRMRDWSTNWAYVLTIIAEINTEFHFEKTPSNEELLREYKKSTEDAEYWSNLLSDDESEFWDDWAKKIRKTKEDK